MQCFRQKLIQPYNVLLISNNKINYFNSNINILFYNVDR